MIDYNDPQMTLESIRAALEVIRELASDGGAAQALESALYEDFVEHIANNGREADARLAKEVLRSKNIDFPRWYT